MPGTVLSRPTIRSRRSRKLARIASAASCGPVTASTRRPLRDLRRARIGVGDPAREHRRQRAVGGEADAPAGHRPGLRRAVADDRALEHARARRERVEAARVGEPRIDLVGEHPDLRMPRAGSRRSRRGRRACSMPPVGLCGVLRISSLVFARDLRFELGRIEREVARFAQVDRHRHRAVGDDLRFVDREIRAPDRSPRRRRRSR